MPLPQWPYRPHSDGKPPGMVWRAHVRQPIRPGRHRTFKPGLAFALACASTPPRPRTSGSPALLPLWLASPMLPARRGPAPSLSAARPPDAGRS